MDERPAEQLGAVLGHVARRHGAVVLAVDHWDLAAWTTSSPESVLCPVSDVDAPSTWAGASADDCGGGGGEQTVVMSTSGFSAPGELPAHLRDFKSIIKPRPGTVYKEQNPMRRSDRGGIPFENEEEENWDKTKRNNGEGHISILSEKAKL